jgi:hypothetical protein
MLAELAPFTVNHPGLAAHLKEVAERFEVELEVEADNTYAVFFADVDLVDNWQAATEELQNGIPAVIEPWVDEDPLTVVQRLLSLRTELNLGNVAWPDRVWMACNVLSDRVADPLAWADIALENGLFPEAAPFVDRAVARGVDLGDGRLARFLSAPAARWAVIPTILKTTESAVDYERLLTLLTPADYGTFQTLFLRDEVIPARSTELLTGSSEIRVGEPSGGQDHP